MRKITRYLSMALVLLMLIGIGTVHADAATISTRPQNGTTSGEPFPKGAGGSNSFRIPAMVTLSDGTVVAAADARWNTTYDGGGLDTMVARSTDNGSSWKYTFANYLGDNGNVYNGSGSTAFIDPALAVTEDDTIYMLVDIYPYGIALNGSGNTAPSTKVGFDSYGRLLLSGNNHSSYGYYLENGKIYSTSGTVVSGYTVDEYFNITGTNGTKTNLFFSDSPYKVVRTGFLYLTTSTDGGASWSAPKLLNLKKSSEMVCLIAPGRGLVTEDGTIVFPVYSYHGDNSPSGNTQRLSFIYSENGTNWQRTSEFSYNWASESAVVELSDGTLRFFFRNGTTNLCYVDYNMSTGSWGSAVNTGLDTNSNCQISAITYSRQSDGKQVILVSCPTGPSEAGSNQSGASYRLNGKIFVGLVNENKTMNWQNAISVTSNNSQFMYSCLTELKDGSVAILYENLENAWGAGSNCYYTMDYKVYSADALGLSFECSHRYQEEILEATCTEDGKVTYTCILCGDSYEEEIPAAGHVTTQVTEAATCTENGAVITSCSVCDYVQTEVIPAAGHSYTGKVTAATCTQQGCTTYTCEICGHSYTDSYTAATGHTYDTTVSATCTEDGYVVYTCEVCADTYNGEAVAALGHSYESTVVAPGCTTEGYTTYVCKTCGHTCTGNEVAALGHSYTAYVTAPTCTEAGYTSFVCEVCDHTYTGSEVAALGHDYVSAVTPPTFETEGYTTHTCRVCGEEKVDTFVPVLNHTYETVTEAPTCTEEGSVVHTCVDCGYCYTEILDALGHSYETVTTDPTCVTSGASVSTCSVCGDVQTEVIPATGHNYETVEIAPTCTQSGYITKTCACGDVITNEIPATGHSYQSVYTAPTCTEAGSTVHTCACGDVLTETVPALGHSYESASVAATCTQSGYTTYTCTTCKDSYTADVVAALGHRYESVVIAPTCTQSGYTSHTCSVCSYSYTSNQVAALGHSYTTEEADGYLVYTCDCGHSYSEALEVNYSYGKVTAFSEGNRYVITLYSNRKYYALSHKNNKISAVQVTVSNNKITSDVTEDLLWDYSGRTLSYETNGTTYYLYTSTSGGWFGGWGGTVTLSVSTGNSSTVTFSGSKVKVGSYYLRYSGGTIKADRSATTTYLYKQTEE